MSNRILHNISEIFGFEPQRQDDTPFHYEVGQKGVKELRHVYTYYGDWLVSEILVIDIYSRIISRIQHREVAEIRFKYE